MDEYRKNTKKGSPGLYKKSRDERRRAERDEQLLANRIALLKQEEAKAWKTIWSAGQGVTAIDDSPSVSNLVLRLKKEF